MSDSIRPVRPFGVTLVAAFTWLGAAMDVVAGILLFALLGVPATVDALGGAGVVVTLATASILLGVIAFALAFGLLRGNPVARVAVTAIEVLGVAASVWHLVVDPLSAWTEGLSIVLALAVLLLLWTGEASRWFAGLGPNQPEA